MHSFAALATLAAFISVAGAQVLYTPASMSGALTGLRYTSVGGSGSYNQVTNLIPGIFPACTANPSCITEPKTISGLLAPFDEEMTFAFRGPMTLYNIAVYQPDSVDDANAPWAQTSSWAAGSAPTNLVFMNNMGGGASGEFSICGGSSQSFANGAWTGTVATANAEIATGVLDEEHEINIVTAETCTARPCDGFARGTANHGWAGSKMLVATFDMPLSSSAAAAATQPAVWALNAQVVRSVQYGCNCRGAGSPGGCGELDVLEVLAGAAADPTQCVSEMYAPKGAVGSGAGGGGSGFFPRPVETRATYGVIFDVQTDSVMILRFESWDYAVGAVTRAAVDGYLNAPAMEVSFAIGGNGGGSSSRLATTSTRNKAQSQS